MPLHAKRQVCRVRDGDGTQAQHTRSWRIAVYLGVGYTVATVAQTTGETTMAVDVHALELKLVRDADGLEVDLLPLQGLWTEEQYLKLTDQTQHLKTSRLREDRYSRVLDRQPHGGDDYGATACGRAIPRAWRLLSRRHGHLRLASGLCRVGKRGLRCVLKDTWRLVSSG